MGQNSGDLVQVSMQGEQMVKAGPAELEAVAKEEVRPPAAPAGLRHVAQSFGASWDQRRQAMTTNSVNATHHMRALSDQSRALSMMVKSLTSSPLSPTEQVQQKVLLYVADANRWMRAKMQILDLYRQSAVHSKHLQHMLLKNSERQAAKAPYAKKQEFIENNLLREPLKRQQNEQYREQQDQSNKEITVLERSLSKLLLPMALKLDKLESKMDDVERNVERNVHDVESKLERKIDE